MAVNETLDNQSSRINKKTNKYKLQTMKEIGDLDCFKSIH